MTIPKYSLICVILLSFQVYLTVCGVNKLRLSIARRSNPVVDYVDEECYRTECLTDVYRVMKALSERPERLVYCKNNPRCDCCIKSDISDDEEKLYFKQLREEYERLGLFVADY